MKQFFWIFLFFTALFTTGCYDIYGRKLKVEFDQVRGNTTITKELYLTKIAENRTGFGRVQQTLQKTITQTGETEYWVYEQLILSTLMHPLESVIYLLIDDIIFPIEVGGQETEAFSKISEETKSLSTSDSTTVTVVTGYSQSDYRFIRIKYALDTEMIDMLQRAESFSIRYYFGPQMVTAIYRPEQVVEVRKWALKR